MINLVPNIITQNEEVIMFNFVYSSSFLQEKDQRFFLNELTPGIMNVKFDSIHCNIQKIFIEKNLSSELQAKN